MRIFTGVNVHDAALDRIRWLYDEFDNIVVSNSGGKDSTVTMNLALIVAEERDRLPLDVVFFDQETEWEGTVEYMRRLRDDPRINLLWFQVPMRGASAWSEDDDFMWAWREEDRDRWMREREPDSITEVSFNTNFIKDMFTGVQRYLHGDAPSAMLGGVRAEESPARRKGLTNSDTYGGVTWGKIGDDKRLHFSFYPIYDWSYRDVWKAIHDYGWDYNVVYDKMYGYGVPVMSMRVSNVHHEAATASTKILQELEPQTWDRLTRRLSGTHVAAHAWSTVMPPTLPYMFDSWKEYRDHLLENMIHDPKKKAKFQRMHARHDRRYVDPSMWNELHKMHVSQILLNDHWGTKARVWTAAHPPMEAAMKRAKEAQEREQSDVRDSAEAAV